MTSPRTTELRVGAFVLVILMLLGAVIFAIGSHKRYFQRQYTLVASFSSIGGLIVGAPVRLAGVTVGRVSAIYFPEDRTKKSVVVEMKVDKDVQERICTDSVASIQTMGLLGDKYIEISPGLPDSPMLEDCAHVKSVDPVDFFNFATKAETTINSLNAVLADLQQVTAQITSGPGFLHAVLYDPAGEKLMMNITSVSASLDALVQELTRTSRTVNQVIAEDGTQLIKEFSETSRSLDRLISGDGAALVKDLSLTSASLNEMIHEFTAVAKSLKVILAKVETGEGSLGALISDPTVYEDLKVVLGGAKRSRMIRSFIQYTIKKHREQQDGGTTHKPAD